MGGKQSNSRDFFRVDAHIPFISCLVPPDEKENLFSDILDKDSVPALRKNPLKKVDISGSGIAFATVERYAAGDLVEMSMVLERVHDGVLVVHGEVVRSQPAGGMYKVAVRFVHLDDRIRDLIIRFVFAREREIMAEKRVGWL
ncbi:MAG: PilZ domain-containing protein [Nitrospirae bacterium]|nr:PilZ domain-containing protein [Nitrospirota bacterium]MCL5237295.1 PilZ domain-containing protein [Nitrospirota bacterium]